MTDDLVSWFRTQLDADERLATAAAEHCACHEPAPRWTFADDLDEGRIIVRGQPHPTVRPSQLSRRWNRTYQDLFAARHIARHDPASVLADITAKRAILDLLEYDQVDVTVPGGPPETMRGRRAVIASPVLRLLASAYSDRPGYRQEWKP